MIAKEVDVTAAKVKMEGWGLKKTREAVDDLKAKFGTIFEQAGEDFDFSKVTEISGNDNDKILSLSKMHIELSAAEDVLADRLEVKRIKDQIEARNSGGGVQQFVPGVPQAMVLPGIPNEERELYDIGKAWLNHDIFKDDAGKFNVKRGLRSEAEFDIDPMNTLFETGAGWPPEVIRSGKLVLSAQRPIQTLDLFPVINVTQAGYIFVQETTFMNAAKERAEGANAAEAQLALSTVTEPVRHVGVWLPATLEQFDDVPAARGYINQRLPFMLRQHVDKQLIVGDYDANDNQKQNNIQGLLDRDGLSERARVGNEPRLDTLRRAMVTCRITGRAFPNAFVLHPEDWVSIQLSKSKGGSYLYGNPADMSTQRVWGLPVAESEVLDQGTGICGDFRGYSSLLMRKGITVEITDAHGTFFIAWKYAIRAGLRIGLAIYRPAAFVKITGMG